MIYLLLPSKLAWSLYGINSDYASDPFSSFCVSTHFFLYMQFLLQKKDHVSMHCATPIIFSVYIGSSYGANLFILKSEHMPLLMM